MDSPSNAPGSCAAASKALRSSTRSPRISRMPMPRSRWMSSHRCSTTKRGSPLPRRTRSPSSTPLTSGASLRATVRQTNCGPRISSPASVVTSFIVEAGFIGTWSWCCSARPPAASGTMLMPMAAVGTLPARRACVMLSGSSAGDRTAGTVAGGCAPADPTSASSPTLTVSNIHLQTTVFVIVEKGCEFGDQLDRSMDGPRPGRWLACRHGDVRLRARVASGVRFVATGARSLRQSVRDRQ